MSDMTQIMFEYSFFRGRSPLKFLMKLSLDYGSHCRLSARGIHSDVIYLYAHNLPHVPSIGPLQEFLQCGFLHCGKPEVLCTIILWSSHLISHTVRPCIFRSMPSVLPFCVSGWSSGHVHVHFMSNCSRRRLQSSRLGSVADDALCHLNATVSFGQMVLVKFQTSLPSWLRSHVRSVSLHHVLRSVLPS